MRTYDEIQCLQLISVSEAVEIIREVFNNSEHVDWHMIPKTYLDIVKDGHVHGDFRAMPARMGNISGIKWVSAFPNNPISNSCPTVIGTILLNCSETGQLLAIVDGTYVTKIRTAAAAAVASEKLSRQGSQIAAFVGCGQQAMLHVQAISHAVPELEKFVFYDHDRQRAKNISKAWAEATGCKTFIANNVEECVKHADILTTLTPSREPIVKGEWLKSGVHINAMGADAKGKREFGDDVYDRVDLWTYDQITQASHSGETQYISSHDIWKKEDCVMSIGQAKRSSVDHDTQITLFDSTGLALQDIAIANWIYEKDIEQEDVLSIRGFGYTEGSQHGGKRS